MEVAEEVARLYGNRTRIRVCGLCYDRDRLLLVSHRGLGAASFWAPPGGGIEFGSSAAENLRREFREETGLDVTVGGFLFVCEYLHPPLHGVELFCHVQPTGGQLRTGHDPEMEAGRQIIHEVRYCTTAELEQLPPEELHGILRLERDALKIRNLRGYFLLE